MAYTDKGQIQKYLAVDIDNSFDTQIDNWIQAVTDWIEQWVGFSFETGERADRYFDGDGSRCQLVDRFYGSMTVEILNTDGSTDQSLTEGQSNDYIAYPLNESYKNEIRLMDASTIGHFPQRSRSLKVNAKFGHSGTVPQAIQLVATKLVGEIVKEGLKGGKLSSVQLGDYQASFMTIDEFAEAMGVYQTLDMYRDVEI
jgi:hypothetical protein